MSQVYVVFDRYDAMYSYDGVEETLDNVYLFESDAVERVSELNKGKMKNDPQSYYIGTELISPKVLSDIADKSNK